MHWFLGFSNGMMPFFSDFTTHFIGWSVRTALDVTTGFFSWESSPLEKKHFSNCISHFGGNFSGFRQSFSTTAVRIDLVSRCFNPISAVGFKEFTQIFIDRSVRTALDVTTGFFSWESSALEKKHFSNCISHFGGNFSGFRQSFSTTAVRIDLVSRCFNPISAVGFKEFTQIFIDRSVRTALDVTTGFFSWESSALEKKTFQIVFHILAETFQVFGKIFPPRQSELIWFLGVSIQYLPLFLRSSRKFLLIGLSELHST